jgi:DNA-binding IscR family transcriptional regulator
VSKDTRLARVAHVLVHMSFNAGTATSETIAAMLDTNPVVVRRIMGALREGGYVSSERGPNGGWRLERPLREITFLNIYKAFEPGSPFTIDRRSRSQPATIIPNAPSNVPPTARCRAHCPRPQPALSRRFRKLRSTNCCPALRASWRKQNLASKHGCYWRRKIMPP